jgi:hypothetical protein
MSENGTLKNNVSDTIIHSLYMQFTGTRKYMNDTCGETMHRERWIEVSLQMLKQPKFPETKNTQYHNPRSIHLSNSKKVFA